MTRSAIEAAISQVLEECAFHNGEITPECAEFIAARLQALGFVVVPREPTDVELIKQLREAAVRTGQIEGLLLTDAAERIAMLAAIDGKEHP